MKGNEANILGIDSTFNAAIFQDKTGGGVESPFSWHLADRYFIHSDISIESDDFLL